MNALKEFFKDHDRKTQVKEVSPFLKSFFGMVIEIFEINFNSKFFCLDFSKFFSGVCFQREEGFKLMLI